MYTVHVRVAYVHSIAHSTDTYWLNCTDVNVCNEWYGHKL